MEYAELLAALTDARADTEIRVRSKSTEYVVTGVAVEYELGPHLTVDDVLDPDVLYPEPPGGLVDEEGNATDHRWRQLREPLARQRAEIAACDGNCTIHRAQVSDKRTVVLTVERATDRS